MADTTQNILINIDVETGKVSSEIDAINEKIKGLGVDNNLQSFKSVRSEIAAAREEAVRLAIAIEDAEAAGQNIDDLAKRYNEVTQRAAQLRDAVDDTNESIANANPDNRFQGLISVAQGAIVAVQGLAGAFTLLGVDAETANVAIAKLQGIIALTDALSSVDKITKGFRDLAAMVNFTTLTQRANNAATAAAAVIQRTFTGAVVQTSAAFTALRVAILATGIGALALVIGGVIAAISNYSDETDKAADSTGKLKTQVDLLNESLDAERRKLEFNTKVRIANLRAAGATEKQIRQAELQGLIELRNAAKKALDDYNAQLKQGLQTGQSFILGNQNDLIKALEDANKAISEKQQENYIQDIEDSKGAGRQKIDQIKRDQEEITKFLTEEQIKERNRRQTAFQIEIDEINRKYDRIKQLARVYRKDITEIERLRQAEIDSLTAKKRVEDETKFVEESLSLLQTQVASISKEINDKANEALNKVQGLDAADAKSRADFRKKQIEDIFKEREAELVSIFQTGAQLRKRQADFILQSRINALKELTTLPDDVRDELAQRYYKDYDETIKQIEGELKDRTQSFRAAKVILGLEIDVQEANRQVDKVDELLEKTLEPFRKLGPESAIAKFIRRTFTSIVTDEDFREIQTQIQKTTKFFNDTEKQILDEREKSIKFAYQARILTIKSAAIEEQIAANNAALANKNALEAQIKLRQDYEIIEQNLRANTLQAETEYNSALNKLAEDRKRNQINLNNDLSQLTARQLRDLRRSREMSLSSTITGRDITTPLENAILPAEVANAKQLLDNLLRLNNEVNTTLETRQNIIKSLKEIDDVFFNNLDTKQPAVEKITKSIETYTKRLTEQGLVERSFTRNFLSGERSRAAFDNALLATQQYYAALAQQENSAFAKQLADLKFRNESTEQAEREHKARLKKINEDYNRDIQILNDAQLQGKLELYDSIGRAIGSLGQLFDESTAVAKGSALAQIAIEAGVGFARGLAIAQQTSQAAGPGAAFAFPIFYAQQVASILQAINRAKQIVQQVPGPAQGGSTSINTTPLPISSTVFRLPPEAQNVRVVNQQSQVVRAYITNEDLRSAQEKQAFLNKLSSF